MARKHHPKPAYVQQFVVPRHLPWNVQDHEVESAGSNKPTFAISLNFKTQPDPETPFPSILTPVQLLRSLEGTADIGGFASVASIFLQNTAALLRAAPGIPPSTRSGDNYKNARRWVESIAENLRETITKITATTGHPEQVQEDLLFALGLVEMMVSSLKVYFKVSGLSKPPNTLTKPLPPTPSYMSETSIELVSTNDLLDHLGPELCEHPAKVLHFDLPLSCLPRAPAKIIQKRSFLNVLTEKSSKFFMCSPSVESSATLVDSDSSNGASVNLAFWRFPNPMIDIFCSDNILLSGTAVKQEKFAQQLTINAFERFVAVDPVDAVSYWRQQGDAASDRSKLRKNLDLWLAFERSLTSWVSFTILQLHCAKKRADLISFWLGVSVICMRFRNFSSCRCIFNGVAHSSIRTLKKSVLLVPIDHKIHYRSLECFFDGHRNYRSYRRSLGSCSSPTIPFLDPLIRDVISTRMATSMSKKIIAKTISTLENCRLVYPFVREDKIQAILDREFNRCLSLTEESLFEASRRLGNLTENRRWNIDPWGFLICKKASDHLRPVGGTCCDC